MRPGRQLWVVAHRWAGLTIALFLIVAGGTGALLPFHEALTLAGRPSLSAAVPPHAGAQPLDAVTLSERVEAQMGGNIPYLQLTVPREQVAQFYVTAQPGRPPLGFDTVWADPYSGAVRLRYHDGVLADGPQAIMSFLYGVHYSLALSEWGSWALGLAALIWTIDCFVGFYLTLPARSRAAPAAHRSPASWWRRWRPAWTVRSHARGHRLNFDLHRAGGLWLWPLLLVFAWSSVGFNLPSVHQPIMRTLGAPSISKERHWSGRSIRQQSTGVRR